MSSLEKLISHLERSNVLKSTQIKEVLRAIDRKAFVLEESKIDAYKDKALPLFEGQTISQPTTIVFMLELLDVKFGQKVLDIGAGSGYVSCLLGGLVGEKGVVYAFEINKRVGRLGKKNIKRAVINNIEHVISDASDKWEENSPYDRIHCGAAFEKSPRELMEQLKIGGVAVFPTQDGCINRITKMSKNKHETEKYGGFLFVPFLKRA